MENTHQNAKPQFNSKPKSLLFMPKFDNESKGVMIKFDNDAQMNQFIKNNSKETSKAIRVTSDDAKSYQQNPGVVFIIPQTKKWNSEAGKELEGDYTLDRVRLTFHNHDELTSKSFATIGVANPKLSFAVSKQRILAFEDKQKRNDFVKYAKTLIDAENKKAGADGLKLNILPKNQNDVIVQQQVMSKTTLKHDKNELNLYNKIHDILDGAKKGQTPASVTEQYIVKNVTKYAKEQENSVEQSSEETADDSQSA